MKRKFYYKDGTVSGKRNRSKILHREDGPAIIRYRQDGSIVFEGYYIEGELHREDGPADIDYYEDGSIKYEAYYIEGKRLSKLGFLNYRHNKTPFIQQELLFMKLSDDEIERKFVKGKLL